MRALTGRCLCGQIQHAANADPTIIAVCHCKNCRNFCPDCGSPIITDVAVMPELTFIKAGTLDDTSWLAPKMHIYCNSAQHWSLIPEDCQMFAKMPA